MKLRILLISVMALGYFFTASLPAAGATTAPSGAEKLTEKMVAKTVTGEVSGVSSRFIAIDYGVADTGAGLEMAFDVNKEVKINGKKSMKEIRLRDTVSVDYLEITTTNAKGERALRRNVAKAITFVRTATKEAQSEVLGKLDE